MTRTRKAQHMNPKADYFICRFSTPTPATFQPSDRITTEDLDDFLAKRGGVAVGEWERVMPGDDNWDPGWGDDATVWRILAIPPAEVGA